MPEPSVSQYLHWVVIETGGNQPYIFDSNRLRHVVGGSELVLQACTTWVTDLCGRSEAVDDGEIVQSLSGKAILLVNSAERGHQIVREISRRALREAPGLEITGAVGRAFNPGLTWDSTTPIAPPPPEWWEPATVDHVTALHATFARQRRARAARPTPELRFRGLPWHLPCHETGLPAVEAYWYGPADTQPVGDGLFARTQGARKKGEERLRRLLGGLALPDLIDDLGGDGWVGVVHADGNRVGTLMTGFPALVAKALSTKELGLPSHREYLKCVAKELDAATSEAFTAAVKEVSPGNKKLLPILVGGDDVTFVCHADLAVPLTRAFLEEFATRTRGKEHLSALARANGEPAGGLTAAAGIAFVKRHHPLAYAVDLAEELTRSAKKLIKPEKSPGDGVSGGDSGPSSLSAYDFHVTHESTIRPLAELRDARRRGGVAGHAGPFVLDDGTPVPERLQPRREKHFLAVLNLLDGAGPPDGRPLSAARAHDLREAFDRGLPAYEQRLAVARTDLNEPDKALLGVREAAGERFVLLPDALLLRGVTGRSQENAEVTAS